MLEKNTNFLFVSVSVSVSVSVPLYSCLVVSCPGAVFFPQFELLRNNMRVREISEITNQRNTHRKNREIGGKEKEKWEKISPQVHTRLKLAIYIVSLLVTRPDFAHRNPGVPHPRRQVEGGALLGCAKSGVE